MNWESEDQGQAAKSRPKVLYSEELFAGEREIIIKHHQEYYRLKITRAGKLILNK
jgi:hemin uptake protein HemP